MRAGVSVAVVLDKDFSNGLSQLSSFDLVWLIDSEVNRRGLRNLDNERRASITTFSATTADKQHALNTALELIEDHHNDFSDMGPWTKLRLIGMRLTPDAKTSLEQYGAELVQEVKGEIHASRC